ncbi:MAG: exodeoxyribonuclease VII large subunit [Candidatus Eisenbacteria bacterium]
MELFPKTSESAPYSVSELTRVIKELLERKVGFVWVKGEVSNFTFHTSGHMYFSLKDGEAQLRCVMFRSANLRLSFSPENGMCVEAKGEVTVYERNGQYQLCVHELSPAGLGALQLALERLKAKLAQEGLFDTERKRPLPAFPETIGVVTSPTGAAVRDILRIIRKRQPGVRVVLNPVRVQGEGAAEEIARAIEEFNRFGQIDVLIVGRGGGSLEDLWAFNEEVVARAVYNSRIPVVSAVGHEIDFTISDLVADVRAPTPSAAAQMVVRDRVEVEKELCALARSLFVAMRTKFSVLRRELERTGGRYGLARTLDMVRQRAQRVDELSRRMEMGVGNAARQKRLALESAAGRLRALDPREVLRRGYAVCRDHRSGRLIRESSQVHLRDRLDIELYRGSVLCSVEEVLENEKVC